MSDDKTPESARAHFMDGARALLASEQYEACMDTIKSYWLRHPEDPEAVKAFWQLMDALNKDELAAHARKLQENTEAGKPDPQSLFEVGFRLIDLRQYELAAMLLASCAAYVPDEPVINYELGFALMNLGNYREAVDYFERARGKDPDFDTLLNLLVSYTLLRQVEDAQKLLPLVTELAKEEDQQKEVTRQATVLKRAQELSGKQQLDARDWLYIQYGTVLLLKSPEPDAGGKFKGIWNDYGRIASTLLILRGVLEGLGVEFPVVEFYDSLSQPLAEGLGELLGARVERYKGQFRDEPALLVMAWAGDIIGKHGEFFSHQKLRSLFAYGLSSADALPVTPDIAGVLAESCAMPWDEHWLVEEPEAGGPAKVEHVEADERDAQIIAGKIIEKISDLESDPSIIATVQETVSYYGSRLNYVVLNNPDAFPNRPEYTAEVPL